MPSPWTVIHLDDTSAQIYCDGFRLDGVFSIENANQIVNAVNFCRNLPLNLIAGRVAVCSFSGVLKPEMLLFATIPEGADHA